jgi:hypothetical protein
LITFNQIKPHTMYTYICYAEEHTLHPYRDNGHSFTIEARNLRQAISYARLHCRHICMKLVNVRREKV